METLKEILYREMEGYTGKGLNSHAYLTVDGQAHIYQITNIGTFNGERFVNLSLFVRLEDEMVIIEKDMNNKPLVDALEQAGVPRDKIVLAYAGEKVPAVAE